MGKKPKGSTYESHTFIAFLASLAVGVTFTNLPPILPLLQAEYGVSNAGMGMLWSQPPS